MRFTIRDVLWFTLVVALGLGWLLSYRSNRAELAELRQESIAHYLAAQSVSAQFVNLTKYYEKAEPGSVKIEASGLVKVRTGERTYMLYDLDSKYVDIPAAAAVVLTAPAAQSTTPKKGN